MKRWLVGGGLLAGLLAWPAWAQNVGPEVYYRCEVAARRATLVGVQERVVLLGRNAGASQLSSASERSRTRVAAAYQACGSDSATLAAYAARAGDQLQDWLNDHPEVEQQLSDLSLKLRQLSAQLTPVQSGQ